MNPYIGDRQLEPYIVDECATCDGFGVTLAQVSRSNPNAWIEVKCPDCNHDSDPGEPNEPPEAD